jgi:hypothetical protein
MFARNALRSLVALYRAAPREVCAQHFEALVVTLRDVLALVSTGTAFPAYSDLCREAVTAFVTLIEKGLPCMNAVVAVEDGVGAVRVWSVLCDAIVSFVAPPHAAPPATAAVGGLAERRASSLIADKKQPPRRFVRICFSSHFSLSDSIFLCLQRSAFSQRSETA